MTKYLIVILFFASQFVFTQQSASSIMSDSNYCEDYFGMVVCDPFRWLENINSEKTQNWLKIQETQLNKYEKKLVIKGNVYNTLLKYSYVNYKPLIKKGIYYFHLSYDYLNSTPSLYYQTKINGREKLLINPERFKENRNDLVSIRDFEVSKNNIYLAFSLSHQGRDWRTIRIINIENKGLLPDIIENVKFSSIQWKDDGFFYLKYDKPGDIGNLMALNKNPQLFYHRIGTGQNEDKLVYELPEIKLTNWFRFEVTSNEKYLILYTYFMNDQKDALKCVSFIKLDSNNFSAPKPFIVMPAKNEKSYDVIDEINGEFLVMTDCVSQTFNVLKYDSGRINKADEFIPAYKNILKETIFANNKILCLYNLNGKYLILIFDLQGNPILVQEFPEGVEINGFYAQKDDNEMFIFVSSFYFPSIIYRIDLELLTCKPVDYTYISFDHTKFETKYIKYISKDGTEIPMYLTYKKGLKRNGKNPVLLYGYGGFGVSMTPFFKQSTILWIENGGVFAVPCIRGGGEEGSDWYKAGRGLNKKNSFDDFIYAARYLIDSSYTNTNKLAIMGGSNGGLLMGVAMTKEPGLFNAVVTEMGLFDMLRYQHFTIGSVWHSEYGVSNDSTEFYNLIDYSPLHNLKAGINYPASLIITSDNDDRVPPFHSYKFQAALDNVSYKDELHLLKVISSAGHYGAETLNDHLMTESLIFSFIFDVLDIKAYTVW